MDQEELTMGREVDERLLAALELAPIGFYSYQFDGTILAIDQVTFDFFELEGPFKDPQSLIGLNISSLITYTGEEGRLRSIVREKARVLGLEYGFRTLKGHDKWGIHNSYLFVDEATGQEAVQTCFYDITKPKLAERAVEEANRRLLEADRHKNEFLAMLSHELRNPLAPIRHSIDIIGRTAPGSERSRRAHAVIERQVGQMARLVEDLLDVTRISGGKVQLRREPLELGGLARTTIEDYHFGFDQGGLALEMVAPEEVWVNGDRARLSQVIGNLIQNALRFGQRGGKVTVTVKRDPARKQASVIVQDTGRGIPPEILPRLFQPFVQADTAIECGKGGLGLGLALVKGLVEMHGGSVVGESEGLGRGATFSITLPLETAAPSAGTRRLRPSRDPLRVLVIEDNVDAAESVRDALELNGHVVDVAHNGSDGIEKARTFGPDAVLCDLGLPDTNGYEVARIMRADPRLGSITLVALTGYAAPDDVASAKDAGFDAHAAKPLSVEDIESILYDASDSRR